MGCLVLRVEGLGVGVGSLWYGFGIASLGILALRLAFCLSSDTNMRGMGV